jgi:hypothetical protein
VRNRRNPEPRFYARATNAGGALASHLWTRATRRPVDSFAILTATAASMIIVVNALFLQSGSRPAPFLATPKPMQAASELSRHMETTIAGRPVAAAATAQPAAAHRDDPIAELIGPSPRIAAVQRALSDYGYGQLKPSGILDDATSAAIERFQREHKLPVTGELSDRLVSDLAAMVGHRLD